VNFNQFLQALYERPWAVLPARLAQFAGLARARAEEGDEAFKRKLSEYRAAYGSVEASGGAVVIGSVAILPICGMVVHKPSWVTDYGLGISTEQTAAALAQLVANDKVKAILLDVDSPGGEVMGTAELAAAVAAAAEQKPVVASVNALCASAAYWIASQAREIAVTPSGMTGSIGVIWVHQDFTGYFEQAGVKTTVIRSAPYKAEGNPYEQLSDEAKANMQAMSDAMYADFVGAVAKGRGVTPATVRKDFGQGRVMLAADAKAAGLVDRVEPFNETLARLLKKTSPSGSGARAQIETVRDFEAFLRDEGRFSHAEAKRIAVGGFKGTEPGAEPAPAPADGGPREGAAAETPKADDGHAVALNPEVEQALRSYVDAVRING
jgi:signal peptide peptidase SppA